MFDNNQPGGLPPAKNQPAKIPVTNSADNSQLPTGAEDIFASTDTGAAPKLKPIMRPRISANAPVGVADVNNSELFGGRQLPFGKIIIPLASALVLIAAGFLIWQAVNYFSLKNKVLNNLGGNNSLVGGQIAPSANPLSATSGAAVNSPVTNVAGANADNDADGLTNNEEINLGTNPNNPDTDADGLTDRAEVNIYHTNPLNPDTDGDGFKDGQEVTGGFDPTKPGNARLFEVPK